MRKEQILTKLACLGSFASAAAVILLLDSMILSVVLICLCGFCATICRNNTEQTAPGWIIVLREIVLLFGAVVTIQVVAFAIELDFAGRDAEIIVGASMALWVTGTVISGEQIDQVLIEAFGTGAPEETAERDGAGSPGEPPDRLASGPGKQGLRAD